MLALSLPGCSTLVFWCQSCDQSVMVNSESPFSCHVTDQLWTFGRLFCVWCLWEEKGSFVLPLSPCCPGKPGVPGKPLLPAEPGSPGGPCRPGSPGGPGGPGLLLEYTPLGT